MTEPPAACHLQPGWSTGLSLAHGAEQQALWNVTLWTLGACLSPGDTDWSLLRALGFSPQGPALRPSPPCQQFCSSLPLSHGASKAGPRARMEKAPTVGCQDLQVGGVPGQ